MQHKKYAAFYFKVLLFFIVVVFLQFCVLSLRKVYGISFGIVIVASNMSAKQKGGKKKYEDLNY